MPRSGARSWSRFLPDSPDQLDSLGFASANADRCILVTGAGGYIGSALVKAIAQAGPRRLVLLDSSESSLFEIQQFMITEHVPCDAVLGSTVDVALLDEICERFRPEIIYHAAAFKHVPLLEFNPVAAVLNNSIGTWNLAQAAIRHGAKKVVLISTDKAVNPHSVMGATKRFAELAIVALSTPACPMNAIRLVNVIGSSGSVVPVLLRQIAEHRPLTVTDQAVDRWFLSLRETIQAVLACGTSSYEGRILLPELGDPVRIVDLAEFLKASTGTGASGLPIQFTGLRPGDKLTEELTYKTEVSEGKIEGPLEVFTTRRPLPSDVEVVMHRLSSCIASRDSLRLVQILSEIVPEYLPSKFVLQQHGHSMAG